MSLAALVLVAQLHVASASVLRVDRPRTPRVEHRVGPMLVMGFGGSLATAGALIGAIGFLPAQSALDAACPGHHCSDAQATRDLYARAATFGAAANVTMVVGAIWVIAGGTWWLAERFGVDPPRVVLAPAPLADGPGLVLVGRF